MIKLNEQNGNKVSDWTKEKAGKKLKVNTIKS